MEIFKRDTVFDFMGKRLPFLGISAILVIASLFLLFTKGLQLGIDFSGGTLIQVQYEQKAPIQNMRDLLGADKRFEKAVVTKFGSENEVIIKIPTTTSSLGKDIGDEIRAILKPTGKYEIRRVDMVGPKVGNALQEKGLTALALALIIILIYVSYRFEWRFAIASILALVHDISIALGAIVLFNVDVNLDILAAILTILGYSLNDTIIVFDRIREGIETSKESELNDYKKMLGKNASWYAKAIIHQNIFSSKRGELMLSIGDDGIVQKAVLKDLIFFGDIRAKKI